MTQTEAPVQLIRDTLPGEANNGTILIQNHQLYEGWEVGFLAKKGQITEEGVLLPQESCRQALVASRLGFAAFVQAATFPDMIALNLSSEQISPRDARMKRDYVRRSQILPRLHVLDEFHRAMALDILFSAGRVPETLKADNGVAYDLYQIENAWNGLCSEDKDKSGINILMQIMACMQPNASLSAAEIAGLIERDPDEIESELDALSRATILFEREEGESVTYRLPEPVYKAMQLYIQKGPSYQAQILANKLSWEKIHPDFRMRKV